MCLQPLGKFFRRYDVDCVQRSDRMPVDYLFSAFQNFRRHSEQVPLGAVGNKSVQRRRQTGTFDGIVLRTSARGFVSASGGVSQRWSLLGFSPIKVERSRRLGFLLLRAATAPCTRKYSRQFSMGGIDRETGILIPVRTCPTCAFIRTQPP